MWVEHVLRENGCHSPEAWTCGWLLSFNLAVRWTLESVVVLAN